MCATPALLRCSALFCCLLACATVLLYPAPAFACTPPPGGLPKHTAADRTRSASVVLEGVVTALSDTGIPGEVATVSVKQYFKGSGPSVVTIRGFGPSGICRSELRVGDRLVFYSVGDPAVELQAFYLSQFDAVAPADAQTIAEVIAAAGQNPVTPVTSDTSNPAIWGTSPSQNFSGWLFGGLVLLIAVGVVFWWLRQRR